MTPRLSLRSERLSELTNGEMTLVVAAANRTGDYPTGDPTGDIQRLLRLTTDLFTGTTTTS